MAGEQTLEDEAIIALVNEACTAFGQDFRYAEAMAKQAAMLQSRRAGSRSLRAA